MTIWQQHRQYAEEMAMNGPHRGDCPFCNSKNTFTASMEMGVLKYNCFKLACDVGGRFDTDMTRAELESYFVKPLLESSSDNKELQSFVYPEHITTEGNATMRRFKQRWPVLAGESLMYDVKDKRAVFPIVHNGTVVDAIGRALDGAVPKWYRYSGQADFFTKRVNPDADVAVVVEDVISAIKVSHFAPSAVGFAILGTSLNVTIMKHLGEFREVVIALDRDATHKTLQYKREVELWTGLPTRAYYLTTTSSMVYKMI